MSYTPFRPRDSGGFTLLELLIAIAVLGLVLVALINGVRFAGQAWETQARRIDRRGDLDAVQNMLRHLIASGRDFTGSGFELKFVGALPVALARNGLYDVELRTLSGQLVLVWQRHMRAPNELAQRSVTELVHGVTNLSLAYYLPETGWQRLSNKKPVLVRLVMELDGGRSVPPLVVAPMIDGKTSDAK